MHVYTYKRRMPIIHQVTDDPPPILPASASSYIMIAIGGYVLVAAQSIAFAKPLNGRLPVPILP